MIGVCVWSHDLDVTIFRFHLMGYGFLSQNPDKYWILKEFLNKDQIIRLSINTFVFYMNLFFNV